jgi:hypothetical protein
LADKHAALAALESELRALDKAVAQGRTGNRVLD